MGAIHPEDEKLCVKDILLRNGPVNIDLMPFFLPLDLLLRLKAIPIHRFGSREGKRI